MKLRIPMFFPILAVIVLVLGFFLIPRERVEAPAPDETRILRDSLLRARTVDSIRLMLYADSVLQLRGDSLRSLFSKTARQVRSHLPSTPTHDTTTLRDTVCLAGEDVRTILIHDSSVIVSRDSARGANVLCVAEREEISQKVQKIEKQARRDRATYLAGGAAVGALILLLWSMVNQ